MGRIIGKRVDEEKEMEGNWGARVIGEELSRAKEKEFDRKSISSFIHSFIQPFRSIRYREPLLLIGY